MQSGPIAVVVVIVALGCSGARPRRDITPPLEPFAWMLGDWHDAQNATSVVAAPGTIYLVSFQDTFNFDVKLIDDAVGGVELVHPLDGRAPDRAVKVWPSEATFVGPDGSTTTLTHAPRMRFPDGSASDSLQYGADGTVVVRLRPFRAEPAPVVERADLELAKAAHDRGSAGWAAGFTDDGQIWTPAHAWVRGRTAVERALAETASMVSWEPTTSRLAPDGRLALTAGRFTKRTSGGKLQRGAYLTIWKRADLQWKVVFSTFHS